ncbi:MAG: aminotransferase class V-fold PLP-dependent enzyme [Bdellovibrionales bacterium]|nr:aminotransferase class V-fold PLP-dependent enzyme [Bdellovibrionales bacterium]
MREALFAFLGSDLAAANPSSLHALGRAAQALVKDAETSILKSFRVTPGPWKVTFTSGGTEANRLAVRAGLARGAGSRWLLSEVEHAGVLDLVPELEREGVRVERLKPAHEGEVRFDIGTLGTTTLLSVIGVGNETGLIQAPLTSHILRADVAPNESRPSYHCDFIAGWGKVALDLSDPGAPDLVTIAGHKLGAPGGIGAIVHRSTFPISRAGTPNLAGIVALKALADHVADLAGEYSRLAPLRDAFERDLRMRIPRVRITGLESPRVPNVSHFTIPGLKKDLSLVAQLDLRGFAVSAGSACASQIPEPSHVLLAMGYSDIDARNSLRISLHPGNTSADLDGLLHALAEILRRHEAL